MGIAAMRSCEQIAVNIGSAISTSRNAVDQVSDLKQEVDALVDEHQNMSKRLLDQEKYITDFRQENLSLKDDNFDLVRGIEALERNVRARAHLLHHCAAACKSS